MSSQCFDQGRLEHPVSPAYPAISPPSFPCCPGSSIPIDGHFERSLTKKQAHRLKGKDSTKGGQSQMIIDMLPDVVLLEIFHIYVDGSSRMEAWHTLVHVCRKWRNVVFWSPRRLNLRLRCTARTPVGKTIDAWPLLPILVWGDDHETRGVDNIIAALEHNGRIRKLNLINLPSSQMENLLAAMQQPFPALEDLQLYAQSETEVVSASFLGGISPQLQELRLACISFPGLPKLLLSAIHLVELHLYDIPHSGYFSPEAIVTGLSALTSLERLHIEFKSPQSRPDRRRRPPPPTRTLLPALTRFQFKGVSEYLDNLVARIDAPLLDQLHITFFHQLIFDTPQLAQFIGRTPRFMTHNKARVRFSDRAVWVITSSIFNFYEDDALHLAIQCGQSDWQLSSLAQVFSSIFHQVLIPAVERLYIHGERHTPLSWQEDIETSQWLEFLHPFATVKNLYISREFTSRITPTLQEIVGGRVTEVLPALQTLFLEWTLPSCVQETIDKFVAARELAGHPIVVSRWNYSSGKPGS